MGVGSRRAGIWQKFLATNKRLHQGAQLILGPNIIINVKVTFAEVVAECQQLALKCKIRLKKYKKPTQDVYIEKMVLFLWSTAQWLGFLGKKTKLSIYHLQIGQQVLETSNKSHVVIAQLCKGKRQKNSNCMKRIVGSNECSFSSQRVVIMQNCKIWGLRSPETTYKSPQRCSKIMNCCVFSKNAVLNL